MSKEKNLTADISKIVEKRINKALRRFENKSHRIQEAQSFSEVGNISLSLITDLLDISENCKILDVLRQLHAKKE